jgi:hypothetical protein
MSNPARDLTGQTFHWLTVLRRVESDKQGRAQWLCRCACSTESVHRSSDITSGRVKSCGCRSSIKIKRRANERGSYGWHRGPAPENIEDACVDW